jgi:lysophospholipase L1-like esterase
MHAAQSNRRPGRRPGDPVIKVLGGDISDPEELPPGALRVGVIGDSITQGGPFRDRYPRTLARLLQRSAPGSIVEAHGVPGDTCPRLAERFGAEILDRFPPYDAVVIQCGINDLHNGAPPLRIQRAIDAMVGWSLEAGQRVILLNTGPIWGHPGWDEVKEDNRRAFNEWVLGRPNVHPVDVSAALSIGAPQRLRPEFVHRDYLHPNQDGHDEIAHAIWRAAFASGWRSAGPGIRYRFTY